MRVLLLGRHGQVGSDLAQALEGRVTLAAPLRQELDLTDAGALERYVRDAKPELILNAAAYTAVDQAESDETTARAVNATAPAVLAAEAKRSGALLVHYSTDYVFDGEKPTPYVEDDATAPLGVYGRTKLEGEQAIAQSGCDHVVLRTSWVYAPRGRNFLLTMLRLAKTQKTLRVVADQRGTPTASGDLAHATLKLLGLDAGSTPEGFERARAGKGLYHATAGGSTTWHGFAQQIFSDWAWRTGGQFVAPRVLPITTADYPTPARRPRNSVLSNAKLHRAFGVKLPGWRDGLGRALSGLLEQAPA